MRRNPLRQFILTALLWLPLVFFAWFWLASGLVWPVIYLSKWVLLKCWPQLIDSVRQQGFIAEIATPLLASSVASGGQSQLGQLILNVNPMVYGYPLPLFVGLVMATPRSRIAATVQIFIGCVAIWLTQSFAVIAETLKLIAFDAGPQGVLAAHQAGLKPESIALAYQFGYLILPAITPVALWILCNRSFIEALTRRNGIEPTGIDRVEPRARFL